MTTAFKKNYVKYYDLLYKDKDYNKEINFIIKILNHYHQPNKNILELGCGTGKHAQLLQQHGYNIFGIDISKEMVKIAQKLKVPSLVADVRSYRHKHTFDAVLSLFHVASYQVLDKDISAYFNTAAIHLKKNNGVFIFDFWYKSAVLSSLPEKRIKVVEDEHIKIIRECIPYHFPSKNVVEVIYKIDFINKKNNSCKKTYEKHIMRYFSIEEIKVYASKVNINIVEAKEWLTCNNLTKTTWNAYCVGVKA